MVTTFLKMTLFYRRVQACMEKIEVKIPEKTESTEKVEGGETSEVSNNETTGTPESTDQPETTENSENKEAKDTETIEEKEKTEVKEEPTVPETIDKFNLYLRCNEEREETWSCERTTVFSLIHRTEPEKSIRVEVRNC